MTDGSAEKTIGQRGAATVPLRAGEPRRWLTTGDLARPTHYILAHGAGTGMDSAFLRDMVSLVDAAGVTVHRFEFSYMAARADGGGKRPAPRAEQLVLEYVSAIADCRARIGAGKRLFIGGKSMGGRIACLASGDRASDIAGVAVLGFPLVPPGKPQSSRAGVLEAMTCPTLIVQGTRDPFGGAEAFQDVRLPANVRLHWVRDGDHDLKPRKASGWSHRDALKDAADAMTVFFDRP